MASRTVPRHLWLAAGRGDLDAVATCLQNGDRINAQEPNVRESSARISNNSQSVLNDLLIVLSRNSIQHSDGYPGVGLSDSPKGRRYILQP